MKKSFKLMVAYHKKDVLFKDDILTPIHAGRELALKTKKADDENLKWLIENTLGDNTGDNISEKNSLYNEMTAVYWAWKNYDKINNPDYVGLMHYRRHFIFKDMPKPYYECDEIGNDYFEKICYSEKNLKEIFDSHDFVCAAPQWRESMYTHYEKNHHIEDLDITVQIIKDLFPDYENAVRNYLDGHDGYFCNMFIFDKNTFFRYSEFIFSVAAELEKRSDMSGKRLFISEWLTGIFITKLLEEGKRPKYLATILAEGEHVIPVALASDNGYAFPMFVTLASMFLTAHKNTFYDVRLLLSGDFSDDNKKRLDEIQKKYPQHKITVYDMGKKYSDIDIEISHVSCPTFYRLKLPTLLSDVNKCIYLDVDVAVQKDLSELFRNNVDDKYLAGVIAAGYQYPYSHVKRNLDELEIPDLDTYVNAGVLIMNLKNIRKDGLEEEFEKLLEKKYSSSDQHILNKACYGKIRVLPLHFNMMTKYHPQDENAYKNMKCLQIAYKLNEWKYARKNPTIIHYADRVKPWQDISLPFAFAWWNAAKELPFFSDVYEQYKGAIYNIAVKYNNWLRILNKPENVYCKYDNMCRIDILLKNLPSNSIQVLDCSGVEKLVEASWFDKSSGSLYWIHDNTGTIDFSFKCQGDFSLSIILLGPDAKSKNGERIPLKIQYTDFQVNGEKILSEAKTVWHDAPFCYDKSVVSGEVVRVHAKWLPVYRPEQSNEADVAKEKYFRELESIKNSVSFKTGRIITWFPRKIRAAIRILKQQGPKGLFKAVKNKFSRKK